MRWAAARSPARHRLRWAGRPRPRGQERPDPAGPPPAERDRPLQRRQQGVGAVRRLQGRKLGELRARRVFPDAAALRSHCCATGPSEENASSAAVLGVTLRVGVFGRGRP